MAASPLISKTSFHARAASLPSIPHPIIDNLDEQLCRLKSSQTASSSSLSHRLDSLKDLYDSVAEVLLLPSNQQNISQDRQPNWVNTMLDGSLRLLDVCGIARDVLLQTREHIQHIQSVLRRRCCAEFTIGSEVVHYLNARKNVKKAIKNCLRDIKTDKNDEANAFEGMLSSLEAVTADILKSLLIHIAGSVTKSKKSSWSLISSLIHPDDDREETSSKNEFEDLDATLSLLACQKKKSSINMMQVDNLKSQMVKLESEIQNLDETLDCLFRHLVKTRATLLNILSH